MTIGSTDENRKRSFGGSHDDRQASGQGEPHAQIRNVKISKNFAGCVLRTRATRDPSQASPGHALFVSTRLRRSAKQESCTKLHDCELTAENAVDSKKWCWAQQNAEKTQPPLKGGG